MRKKKLSLGVRFLLWFVSFLLSLALLASVTVAITVADIRTVTSKDNLRGFVHQLITAPGNIRGSVPVTPGTLGLYTAPSPQRALSAPCRAQNVLLRDDASGVASDLTEKLIDMLYEQLEENFEGELNVSQEELESIIENSTVKDFVVNKTADLISDYFVGEVTTTFEPEEIIQLLEENKEQIETVIGQPIPEEVKEQIAEIFDTNEIIQKVEAEGLAGFMELTGTTIPGLPEVYESENALGEQLAQLLGMPTVAGMVADMARSLTNGQLNGISSVNDIMTIFREATSQKVLTHWILISLALVAAIILVNILQLPTGLRRAGYPLMLAGIMIIPCLLAQFVPDLFSGIAVLSILQQILLMITPVYAVTFGTGLVLMITGIVLGIILNRKRKNTVTRAPLYAASTPAPIPASVPASASVSVETAPVPEKAPVEDAPVEEAPVEEAPAEEAPVEDAPVEDAPVEESPAEESPAEEASSPVAE